MANLQSVVKELQQQNNTLSDVKESITSMLSEDLKRRKEEERRVGDDEEARRERDKEKRKAQSRPASFRQGLAQGSGISTVTDLLKGFTGALGGGSLGGLLGLAAGKLFVPVLTGLLGAKYLSKWVKPITDRIFGEGATSEIFGQQIPVDKIGGAIAGVIGMLLAPALIKKALTATFGIGAATGRLILSRIIGKMGIAAAATAAGETVGDLVNEATDKKKTKADIKKSSKFKRFAQLFKVVGLGLGRLTIPGAIIGTAAAATYFLADYIQNKQDEMIADLDVNIKKRMAKFPTLIAEENFKEAATALRQEHYRVHALGLPADESSQMANWEAIDAMPDSPTKKNLFKIHKALVTPMPDNFDLTTESATNYADVQLAGQLAGLEETIMKRLPFTFSQMSRFQQEGIVASIIMGLPISGAGVNKGKLAADFVAANFPESGSGRPPPVYGGRSKLDPRLQMLKDDPLALANSYLKGHTGQTINIGTVDNSTNHGGGQSSSGQSMLYQFNPTYDHNYNKIEYGIAGSGNSTLGILGVR